MFWILPFQFLSLYFPTLFPHFLPPSLTPFFLAPDMEQLWIRHVTMHFFLFFMADNVKINYLTELPLQISIDVNTLTEL